MPGREARAQEGAPRAIASTINSGDYDDYLMLAVDNQGKTLSGYYNDGKCRFMFRDALSPTELGQRRELGEAYIVDSWVPAHPDHYFTTVIYSQLPKGYRFQLTLEPGSNDGSRPKDCRSRITLDRSDQVGDSLNDIGVVRKRNAHVFTITRTGGKLIRASREERLPPPGTGVWITRTYPPDSSPKGFVYLNWYDPRGTSHHGYAREKDLYASQPIP
jgi:hypothetical protein